MGEVIARQRGLVQDFVGDGILAVYGAPVADPEHAWHAVVTAVEMQAALVGLNRSWTARGLPTLAMGIAVHTGEAFAGTIGAGRRKKYGVLGDTVNTVARIEGLNRDLGTALLVSGATLQSLRDRVIVKATRVATVKGKAQPVDVHELVGLPGGDP
jgi:adenylate cyclase